MNRIIEKLEGREVLDVPYAYVNCWQNYTKNAVLECLAQDLADAAVSRNASNRELTSTIQRQLESPGLVILDEVDQLSETEVLYDLHQLPGVSLVAVANREIDRFAGLEDRIHPRSWSASESRSDRRRGMDEFNMYNQTDYSEKEPIQHLLAPNS